MTWQEQAESGWTIIVIARINLFNTNLIIFSFVHTESGSELVINGMNHQEKEFTVDLPRKK